MVIHACMLAICQNFLFVPRDSSVHLFYVFVCADVIVVASENRVSPEKRFLVFSYFNPTYHI